MANINLSVRWSNPEAIAKRVRYARVDNTSSPSYITVSPNPTTSPTNIATNIPNGQYVVEQTSVYSDGRICQPSYSYTAGCQGLLSISAYISGNNIIVQYLAPYDVTSVKINVNYPNGGNFTSIYTNNGNDIVIAMPVGVNGDYGVTGQSVCDATSQFYSPVSNQVVVSRTTTNVTVANNISGVTITEVNGMAGFTLPSNVTQGNIVAGTHNAYYGPTTVVFTGTPGAGRSASLLVNGTVTQCVALINSNGGSAIFTAASFSDTDNINIIFSPSTC